MKKDGETDEVYVDVHVGRRLKELRVRVKWSQARLGNEVGVAFQQIQKYEKGKNRIGASRLFQFSRIFGVSVSHFFDGLESSSADPELVVHAEETRAFVEAYYAIPEGPVRAQIFSLVRGMADSEDERNRKGQGGDVKVA